jgi:5-methylcytosine-specific restriction endonuclease McrA
VNASGSEGREHVVDHIVPFHGLDDPLRLDENNLQTLCHTHHQQKTARDQRLGR